MNVLKDETDTTGEGTLNKALWNHEWDVHDMLPPNIIPSLESYSRLKGINIGYLIPPLVSSVAHSMRGAEIVVNAGSHIEPALLSAVVVGPKGTNKSGAFNYIMEGIKNLEKSDIEEAKQEFTASNNEDVEEPDKKKKKVNFDQTMFQRYLTRMTAAAITELLDKRSDLTDGKPHVILVYEELSLFLGFIIENPDFMREFLCLTQGSELRKNTKGAGLASIKSPRVNLLGFIQANVLQTQMVNFGQDACGFFDRLLFMAPKPPLKDLEMEWTTVVDEGFNVVEVLKSIDDFHKDEKQYVFSPDAKIFLKEECDRVTSTVKENLYCDDAWGISAKHMTKVYRLSGVLHVLDIFTRKVVPNGNYLQIEVESCRRAASLTTYSDQVLNTLKNSISGYDLAPRKQQMLNPGPSGRASNVAKTKWFEDLADFDKPASFFAKYSKQISNIYKLPHTDGEVLLKSIRTAGYYPQGKGKSSFELSQYFVEILWNAGLLKKCDVDGRKVGLLRTTDVITAATLEKINAVKSEEPGFNLL